MISFSVVIPLYNGGKTVQRSIESVLRQNYPHFEVIVINDGSTDNGPEIVKGTGDPRITVIDQANRGVAAARNRGIAGANNEWIAFLDADDVWHADFLTTIVHLIGRFPDCQVISAGYQMSTGDGTVLCPVFKGLHFPSRCGVIRNYFEVCTYSSPPVTSSSVAICKQALVEIGGFPEGVVSGEDLLTWSSLALISDIAFCREPKVTIHLDMTRDHRRPQVPDYVGGELRNLIEVAPQNRKLWVKRYLGKWHKMRAHSYIELKENLSAVAEIKKSVYFNPFSRVWLFLPYMILPDRMRGLAKMIRY